MEKYNKIISRFSHGFNAAWTLFTWFPLIYNYYRYDNILIIYNNLTWWSWTAQVFFYTILHFKLSPIWNRVRNTNILIINKIYNLINNRFMPNIVILYGMTCGISWFVFIFFSYILFKNPAMVYNEAMKNNSGGLIQVANILVHYYTVIGINMWTIYMFDEIRTISKNYINNELRKKIRFSTTWLLFIFFYLCYWKFNFIGIYNNYKMDFDNIGMDIFIFIFTVMFCIINNAIYLELVLK